MSTNISKQKRDDLLNKIQEIRTYIASAKQDDNTARLLSYLSELEKDVNGKKYGLVFEEHREKIDDELATHLPVLSEEKDLFIDNGGQMNFLIEGDNLASLKLLEKTHKGKIDLIYIDPPYNTGKDSGEGGDFILLAACLDDCEHFFTIRNSINQAEPLSTCKEAFYSRIFLRLSTGLSGFRRFFIGNALLINLALPASKINGAQTVKTAKTVPIRVRDR